MLLLQRLSTRFRHCRSLATFTRPKSLKNIKNSTVVILGNDEFSLAENQARNHGQIYSDLGYNILHCTLPFPDYHTYNHKRIQDFATEVMDTLTSSTEAKDLIIHAISNNGYIVFQHIFELILNRSFPLGFEQKSLDFSQYNILGAVFDSCPYSCSLIPSPFAGYLGKIGTSLPPDPRYFYYDLNLHLRLHKKSFGDFMSKVEEMEKAEDIVNINCRSYMEGFKSPGQHGLVTPLFFPQLYICSSSDHIAPINFTQLVSQFQEEKGNEKVLVVDFESSKHANHFESFPESYVSYIEYFLKEIGSLQ